MAGPTTIGGLVRAGLVGLVPLLAGCDAAGTPGGRLADTIPVDGHPFAVAPLDDGTLLVSLSYGDERGGAIAVLQPVAARFAVRQTIPVAGRPASIAVSHDGRMVAVAADDTTILFDRTRLLSRQGDAVLARIRGQRGAIEVAFSPDDRLLAISEEGTGRVMLLSPGRADMVPVEIAVGHAPVGLAFSRDGRWLYALSETDGGLGASCPGPAGHGAAAPGTVSTIAVAAGQAPRVTATARIGCGPVRIVLSPDDGTAFVSLRSEDRVAAFRTESLRDGSGARRAAVDVGPAPVGLALSGDGATLRVANSDRFDTGAGGSISCIAVAADGGGLVRLADTPSGSFPREIARLPDGRMVVTLFRSDALQLLPARC